MIEVTRGSGPIILGLPHTGTDIPEDLRRCFNTRGLQIADTDWNIHRLYDGLLDDVTTVRTPIHRYVIDVNRDPDGASLYPGQNTTSLCPLTDFDGAPIYRPGMEPSDQEILRRRRLFHAPYHAALEDEIARVRADHGKAILYDCHSIRSNIPYLFDGELPNFNIGTNLTTSCAERVEKTVEEICEAAEGYSSVTNGRFRGGWTTRHYGRPEAGVHAIQMELAQRCYMHEFPPWEYDDKAAGRVRPHLYKMLNALQEIVQNGRLT